MMFKNFGLVLLGIVGASGSRVEQLQPYNARVPEKMRGGRRGRSSPPSVPKSSTSTKPVETEPLQVVEFHQIDLMSQLPDTAPLAEFLKQKKSSLFPNPEMGNILVYFDETVRELLLFKASISDTVAQMSRSSAFL